MKEPPTEKPVPSVNPVLTFPPPQPAIEQAIGSLELKQSGITPNSAANSDRLFSFRPNSRQASDRKGDSGRFHNDGRSRCKAAWVLIALALLISGCQALTNPKKPDLPIGLKPFSHLGGNSPGDIVFIGNDGYPYSCVPAHMSARYGKNIQRAKSEELTNREYEITNAFRGTVEALAVRGDISEATKDQLTRLASLKLRIDEATREYLEDGTSAFSGFMLKQQSGNLRSFSAQIVDSCGLEEVSLILEVLKVVRGSYIAEWSAELDLHAKVEALEILGGEVQGNWDNNRKVRVVSTRSVALGYRDWPLPMDRLRTARETGTY